MNTLTRWAVLAIFLLGAIACYVFGVPKGGVVFLVLGLIFEALFWCGVFGRKRSTP